MDQNHEIAPALGEFIARLTSLKEQSEVILRNVSSEETTAVAADVTPAGALEELVRKYRDQAGIKTAVRTVSKPEYGVSRMIALLADLPVLEFWIYKKAGIKRKFSSAPLPENTFFQRVTNPLRKLLSTAALYRNNYRRMSLEQLIEEQTQKMEAFLSLLSESKKASGELYEELYDRHIEMQEDAVRAQQRINKIREYIREVEEVNHVSKDLKFDSKSEAGLRISTLITHIHKYSAPITEFYDDCTATVNWLFEVQQSYHTFEDMISNYSRMINAVRRRTSNLQIYVSDFNRITARLKEGVNITRELRQSMTALTAGIYASASQIQEGVHQMIGTYGSMEGLQLPAYVNQILSGPLSDVMEANRMLQGPSVLQLASAEATTELERGNVPKGS